MQRLDFRAMGCHMTAMIDAGQPTASLDAVPAWFEAWEQIFSGFRADSELSQLNRRAGHWTRVSANLWEVTHLALVAARWTEGLYSPTILNALEAAGYDRTFDEITAGAPVIPRTAPAQWTTTSASPTNLSRLSRSSNVP